MFVIKSKKELRLEMLNQYLKGHTKGMETGLEKAIKEGGVKAEEIAETLREAQKEQKSSMDYIDKHELVSATQMKSERLTYLEELFKNGVYIKDIHTFKNHAQVFYKLGYEMANFENEE